MGKAEKISKTRKRARFAIRDEGERHTDVPLLATKLHKPHAPAHIVHRQRLLDELDRGRELPLVVVSAPAGYGKSTLVAEWLEGFDRPSIWLSLDPGDSDLSVFLSYVVMGIESLFPGACSATRAALAAPELPSARVLASHLINELDVIEASFTLVLDDYHRLEGTAVHDLIDELLKYPAGDVHLVIVTRRDPPLPMASLRANNRMIEVRLDDLQFLRGEAAALMEELLGVNLSDMALDRLMELTEGWVAGVQLIALTARHRPEPEAFLLNLKGTIRDIRDYLLSEVLTQQSPELRDCILKTSVVDRFSASFCEGVCENCAGCPLAGEAMMQNLNQTGIFIIPLDAEGKWFRYHHLFQDLLREQLEREVGVDQVAILHGRASRWFEGLGSIGEAIDHALEARDSARAAELVEKHRITEFNADRWFVVRNWLRKIPAEAKDGRPGILLAQAWIRYNQVRLSEIAALVEQAESCLTREGGENSGLTVEINFHKAILRFWQGDAESVLEFVGKAKRQLSPRFVFVRSDLEVYWGFGNQMSGRGAEAVEELERYLREDLESNPMMVTRRIATIGFIHLLSCQSAAVRQAAMRLRDAAEKSMLPNTVVWSCYIHGVSCFQSGDFEAAQSYLREVSEQRHILHHHAARSGLAWLALTHEAMEQRDEADDILDLLQEFVRESGDPAGLAIADASRARIALWRGEMEIAARLLPPGMGTPDAAAMVFFMELPCVTQCRVSLANGVKEEVASAAKMLTALRKGLEDLHNTFHLIDVMVLEAWAFRLMGESDKAEEIFEAALKLAEPGWWIRPFLEAGEVALALSDVNGGDRSPFRKEIRNWLLKRQETGSAALSGGPAVQGAPEQTLVDPLTNRELDVLELIGQRLYDKEIADRLSISPGTVKAHLKHIYQKLEVGNRRAAVERATALGIL